MITFSVSENLQKMELCFKLKIHPSLEFFYIMLNNLREVKDANDCNDYLM